MKRDGREGRERKGRKEERKEGARRERGRGRDMCNVTSLNSY